MIYTDEDKKDYERITEELDRVIDYISHPSNSVFDYFVDNGDRLDNFMKSMIKTLRYYEKEILDINNENASMKNMLNMKDKKILDLEIHSFIKERKIDELENKLDEERINTQYWINEYNSKQNPSVVTPMTTTVNDNFKLFIEALNEDNYLSIDYEFSENSDHKELCHEISEIVRHLQDDYNELESTKEEIGSDIDNCREKIDSIKDEIMCRIDDFKETLSEYVKQAIDEQTDELNSIIDRF